jgi:hypothetical protein
MVHTTPEFATSNLILDFEFDQLLESHKHVINIIMGFRDMGCYISYRRPRRFFRSSYLDLLSPIEVPCTDSCSYILLAPKSQDEISVSERDVMSLKLNISFVL